MEFLLSTAFFALFALNGHFMDGNPISVFLHRIRVIHTLSNSRTSAVSMAIFFAASFFKSKSFSFS